MSESLRPVSDDNCATVSVYDLAGRFLGTERVARVCVARPPGAPWWTDTLEFRLGRRGWQSAVQQIEDAPRGPAIAAVTAVRAYVIHEGEVVASDAIGGIEVEASYEGGCVTCTVKAESFARGEQVVVQAHLAVYEVQ